MTLKIAVLAPIPRARVSSVATVNIGVRARRRAACRTSRIRSNIGCAPRPELYGIGANVFQPHNRSRS